MNQHHELRIQHLSGGSKEGKQILSDVTCVFDSRKIYAIMGPNGSGKSTLANMIMGNPEFTMTASEKGSLWFDTDCFDSYGTDRRAQLGLFLAFQNPIAVPGVSVVQLLRSAYQTTHKEKNISMTSFMGEIQKYRDMLHIDATLLGRSIHDGFSGGERKKIELLQALLLHPSFAIFDEIDTGLDVDALRLVAAGIHELHDAGVGVILITHYQRLLKYVTPQTVYVFSAGKLVSTGTNTLAKRIEKEGYQIVK